MFLLIQCMEATLPIGGRILVKREDPMWLVEAEGRRLRIHMPTWDTLEPARAAPSDVVALVQFAILPAVLDGMGRRLELSLGPDRIVARF